MKGNAFGGYEKPNFQPKNLTSDMWEPITTTNNYSAYTPERPTPRQENRFSDEARHSERRQQSANPAMEAAERSRSTQNKNKKTAFSDKKTKEKSRIETKEKARHKRVPEKESRPISSGKVTKEKPAKQKKSMSQRQRVSAEKKRQKTNLAYVRMIKSGKTPDEARLIINRRKIRSRKIKTLSNVGFFLVFALCFLISFSYFRGAEIKEIEFGGDEVYSQTEILEAGNIAVGQNMLTVNEKKLNRDITKSLPFVSRIDVDYKLPDVLALNVVSTKEQLILKCDRKYICIDSEGKVVSDKKKKLAEGQFLVQGMLEQEYIVGEPFEVSEENKERYNIACEFAKAAEMADTLNYGVLDLKDTDNIIFTYRSKVRIYFGDSSNLSGKLESAIGIFNGSDVGDKTGYINLKYDIGAYFMEGTME